LQLEISSAGLSNAQLPKDIKTMLHESSHPEETKE
jgi:hypothetical protein